MQLNKDLNVGSCFFPPQCISLVWLPTIAQQQTNRGRAAVLSWAAQSYMAEQQRKEIKDDDVTVLPLFCDGWPLRNKHIFWMQLMTCHSSKVGISADILTQWSSVFMHIFSSDLTWFQPGENTLRGHIWYHWDSVTQIWQPCGLSDPSQTNLRLLYDWGCCIPNRAAWSVAVLGQVGQDLNKLVLCKIQDGM